MANELQTWYTDGARIYVSPTSAVTSKVKGQDRKITWFVWHAENEKSQKHQNWKEGCDPTGNTAHQVRGQKVKGQSYQAD